MYDKTQEFMTEMVNAYLESAWVTGFIYTGNPDDEIRELDSVIECHEWKDLLSPADYSRAMLNCSQFISEVRLSDVPHERPTLDELIDVMSANDWGHNLFLTANGHGVGFWDRGLGELGEKLTKLSKNIGELNAWANEDGTEAGLE